MQPIEVTARFDTQGRITPISFVLEEIVYSIDSIGRRWKDETGEHILVMPPAGQVFELVFSPRERRWFLAKTGRGRLFA